MTNPIEQAEIRRRAQDAKEYLIAQIVWEAQQENAPLSEVERKMLYFTESVETLPDIYEVNVQFEQVCDDAKYEAKISHLLRLARKRVRKESTDGAERWRQAEKDLRQEDHYLGVMVGNSHRPVGGFWTVAIWSAGVIAAIFGAMFLWDSLEEKHMIPAWANRISPRAWGWGATAAMLILVIILNGGLVDLKDFVSRARDYFPLSAFRKRSGDQK